jgi:hypothetical protein
MSMAFPMAAFRALRSGLVGVLLCSAGACATSSTARHEVAGVARATASAPRAQENNDGLMMRAEHGSIDRDDAEETIARHFAKLRRCYEAAADATAFAEGAVTLHFEIAVDGRTTAVNVESSRLGNYAVESCLTNTASAIRFSRPHGNGRASFEYTLEFRSSAERAVVDLPDEAALPLRTALLARVGGDCGKLGPGALTATVYVDRRGQVQSAGLAGKTPVEAERAVCLTSSFARAPLPAPALTGDALGRLSFALDDAEVQAAVAAAAPPPRHARKDRLAARARRR